MKIAHVHFYVEDAAKQRDWFIRTLGFSSISNLVNHDTYTEVVSNNSVCFLISSPLNSSSPVINYLQSHPPGVADIAFQVQELEYFLAKASHLGVKVLEPLVKYKTEQGDVKRAKIQGWGSLHHTLIDNTSNYLDLPLIGNLQHYIVDIDHVVLNVPVGELAPAATWYKNLFNFQLQQTFNIQTSHSGLFSEALIDASGTVQLNINEPTSANSQIHKFIEANRGSGIQHLALRSTNILQTVANLRHCGLDFLAIPKVYYTKLKQRYKKGDLPDLSLAELAAIERGQILLNWHKSNPESLLMQIFTNPIFDQPTFFFEFIERRNQAQGFGEGNFQALFEAMERDQIQRNYLGERTPRRGIADR